MHQYERRAKSGDVLCTTKRPPGESRRTSACASSSARERTPSLADARASLEELAAAVGTDLTAGEEREEVDTVGGYLVTRIGRVPVRGEIVPGPQPFEIEVLDADPRRVKKVKIFRSKRPPRGREPRREQEGDAGRGAPAREAGATESPASEETTASPPVALPAPTRQP